MLTHSMVEEWFWLCWWCERFDLSGRVSSRSNVGGMQANLLKFSNWLKMDVIIGFNGDDGVIASFWRISMQSRMPSWSGVSSESEIVDIMYGVESLCTGTATAFMRTAHNCFRSSSVNLFMFQFPFRVIWMDLSASGLDLPGSDVLE